MDKTIERIIQVPAPDDGDIYQQVTRLIEALGWEGYHTHYTGEELDNGDYGEDVHDYTVRLPDHQLDILEFLDDMGAFGY